jgi:hypothetical protein
MLIFLQKLLVFNSVLLVAILLMADCTLAQSIAPSSPMGQQVTTQLAQSSNSTSSELTTN